MLDRKKPLSKKILKILRCFEMNILALICIPASVILAVVSVFYYKKKAADVLMLLAWICGGFALISGISDILQRINANDIAGVLDIYPTMLKFFAAELVVLVLCGAVKIFKKN